MNTPKTTNIETRNDMIAFFSLVTCQNDETTPNLDFYGNSWCGELT